MKRIGVLNSGGDCPGLNAVIHGVVGAASQMGIEVVGIKYGFEGLLAPASYRVLTPADTIGILQQGGTILGTTNKGHFISKLGMGTPEEISKGIIENARGTMQQLSLDALVVIGGDGSLTTALQLYRAGFPVVGVPKTIDNDLLATARTFGFDSACAMVVDALDRLQTTAQSHERVMVLEVMGRHAGWIAMWGGIAGGANVILIPELEYDLDKVADFIKQRDADGYKSTLVVVAEGAHLPEGGLSTRSGSAGAEVRLGGIGEIIAQELEVRTGKDTRACVLGHLQRGGQPTALDRIIGARFGVKAVKLAAEGGFGRMVSYDAYRVVSVPIEEAVHQLRRVQDNGEIVETARAIGIHLGQ
ncbi:6-phosphofructokinase [Persicirhabdus sediminis]|uniref:ATP-dependent 6-phosphofructokinase n=1 Tax=Persicirhabdus sediminis TaxID=454144 RepID=A0A8J7MCY7_9BACT|nr:ATP-dependent 6-phosphofructokinase [Persicirhabdus sediminis]MBK1791072.1 6-phosphofructokinase [Persicirhabdus sediminis]